MKSSPFVKLSSLCLLALALSSSGDLQAKNLKLLNVSYDPTREFYEKYNKIFESYYESEHGKKINVIQSHGGSGAQARGLNEAGQFRAIESVAGGKLKAWQIEALVKHMGTGSGMDELRSAVGRGGGDQYVEAMLASLPEGERGALSAGGGGFAALGKGAGRIGMGEANALQVEDMKMETGQYVAESLMDMREIIKDIAQTWVKIMGSNPLETMTKLTGAGAQASEALKALPWEQIGDIINQIPWDTIGYKIAKGFTWWLNDARQKMTDLSALGKWVGGSPP